MAKSGIYTAEHTEFLNAHVSGISFADLTRMFNEHFGTNRTEKSIHARCYRLGLKNGIKPTPPKPFTTESNDPCPVGTERVNSHGMIKIKTGMPRSWRLKHHAIWEEHFGKIPKRGVVIFADGDNRNFALENLICIPRNEYSWLVSKKLYPGNAESIKSAALLAKLAIAVKKKNEIQQL